MINSPVYSKAVDAEVSLYFQLSKLPFASFVVGLLHLKVERLQIAPNSLCFGYCCMFILFLNMLLDPELLTIEE